MNTQTSKEPIYIVRKQWDSISQRPEMVFQTYAEASAFVAANCGKDKMYITTKYE